MHQFIEFVRSLTNPDQLIQLLSTVLSGWLGYLALFAVVFAESGAALDSVMIGGQFVMRGGKLLTLDESKLRRDVQTAVDRLDAVNAPALCFARGVADYVGAFCIGQAHAPHAVHRCLEESAYTVAKN